MLTAQLILTYIQLASERAMKFHYTMACVNKLWNAFATAIFASWFSKSVSSHFLSCFCVVCAQIVELTFAVLEIFHSLEIQISRDLCEIQIVKLF